MTLATELPKHLTGTWRVKATDFGAALPGDAIVEVELAEFTPVEGFEDSDPRVQPPLADEAAVTLHVLFNSTPQAAREAFSTLRAEVKAAANALTRAREENWRLTRIERRVDYAAETPHRVMDCTLAVDTIVS